MLDPEGRLSHSWGAWRYVCHLALVKGAQEVRWSPDVPAHHASDTLEGNERQNRVSAMAQPRLSLHQGEQSPSHTGFSSRKALGLDLGREQPCMALGLCSHLRLCPLPCVILSTPRDSGAVPSLPQAVSDAVSPAGAHALAVDTSPPAQ